MLFLSLKYVWLYKICVCVCVFLTRNCNVCENVFLSNNFVNSAYFIFSAYFKCTMHVYH